MAKPAIKILFKRMILLGFVLVLGSSLFSVLRHHVWGCRRGNYRNPQFVVDSARRRWLTRRPKVQINRIVWRKDLSLSGSFVRSDQNRRSAPARYFRWIQRLSRRSGHQRFGHESVCG